MTAVLYVYSFPFGTTIFFYQLRLHNKGIDSLVPRIVAVFVNRPSTIRGADSPMQMIEICSKELLSIAC